MAVVFGVCAKKQAGKSSLCKFFQELLPDSKVVEFAFAKALKDLAIQKFAIPSKSCYGSDADKNYPIATWGRFFGPEVRAKYKKESDSLLSGREFLQILGTDILRAGNLNGMASDYHFEILKSWLTEKLDLKFVDNKLSGDYNFQNIWVDVLVSDVKKASSDHDLITVSDVRFFNEIDAIKGLDGKLIRLYRNAGTTDSIPHASELEMEQMDDELFNYILEEQDNQNLGQLKNFAISVLFREGLLGMAGMSI